jgi:hypothetical protein
MRVSSVEWFIMAAELVCGLVLASSMGWPVWAGLAISIPVGVTLQWVYRRGSDDRLKAAWLFECAYTLWRRGGLSISMSVAWAKTLKDQFGDRWSGQQAAEHQIARWQH